MTPPSLLGISDLSFGPGWASRSHAHADHHETLVILAGKVALGAGGQQAAGGAGSVICYPPRIEHQEWNTGDRNLRLFCVAWQGTASPPLYTHDRSGRVEYLLRWMIELFPLRGEEEQRTANGLLQAVLYECQRGADAPNRACVEAARRYIRTHLAETLDLDTLAGVACLSRFHFARVFKEETGLPPMRYVRATRIEAARSLMATTSMTLDAIARQVGLGEAYHLSRVIKRVTGCAPRTLRRPVAPV